MVCRSKQMSTNMIFPHGWNASFSLHTEGGCRVGSVYVSVAGRSEIRIRDGVGWGGGDGKAWKGKGIWLKRSVLLFPLLSVWIHHVVLEDGRPGRGNDVNVRRKSESSVRIRGVVSPTPWMPWSGGVTDSWLRQGGGRRREGWGAGGDGSGGSRSTGWLLSWPSCSNSWCNNHWQWKMKIVSLFLFYLNEKNGVLMESIWDQNY